MMGRRWLNVLLLLSSLPAAAQNLGTLTANASVQLDGGVPYTNAYVVTSGSTQYAMANSGQDIEVFTLAGSFLMNQPGTFSTFAVADAYNLGTTTATLVFAAETGGACSVALCIDAFIWTSAGFVLQTQVTTNIAFSQQPLSMTVDTTTSTIRVYFQSYNVPTLYEQDFTITGGVVTAVNTPLSRTVATNNLTPTWGLTTDATPYPTGLLYLSDVNSNLYTVNKDYITNAAETVTVYSTLATGGYSGVGGLFLYSLPFILTADGALHDVVELKAGATANPILIGYFTVNASSGRPITGFAATVNATDTVMLVTEVLGQSDAGTNPWLHVFDINGFPDGGSSDGGPTGVDSGIPTVPIVPPGPGQLTGTANACNCSTAGSAPGLLVLLLPLLAPRRRR